MKARPILFNAEMVRALIDGRKTQTRRVIVERSFSPFKGCSFKDLLNVGHWHSAAKGAWRGFLKRFPGVAVGEAVCPYGQPGDLLWVRETVAISPVTGETDDVFYRADSNHPDVEHNAKWKPSIHMPRWASRITLRITDVRVEQVQEITGKDAMWEGVGMLLADTWPEPMAMTKAVQQSRRSGFRLLWDSINAKRGFGWDANPWVWVVEFEVIKENVDQVIADERL